MFERFTDRAKQVVVLAQQEARTLGHDRIGTEHVLLGLLAERHGVGAQVLASFGLRLDVVRQQVARRAQGQADPEALRTIGIDLDAVRRKVEEAFGPGALDRRRAKRQGHIPFTKEAKKALELSLREALRLKHRHIGSEHILLGLVRSGEGLSGELLHEAGVTHAGVEAQVLGEAASG